MIGKRIFFWLCVLILPACYFDSVEDIRDGLVDDCQTEQVSFLMDVLPILQTNCNDLVCHGGVFPQGSINLETHATVRTVGLNGRLVGSIKHQAGFSPMPLNAEKLGDCDIEKIVAWIDQGALDN